MSEEKIIDRDNFIDFLATIKPKDIEKLITERGKPVKPICPAFFFPPKE